MVMHETPLRPSSAVRPEDASGDADTSTGGVHLPTLFAHLVKLGSEEAGALASAAAASTAAAAGTNREEKTDNNLSSPPPFPTVANNPEQTAMFVRDSCGVRGWMMYALEDARVDPVVVASATTLAMRLLQRRYHRCPPLDAAASTGLGCDRRNSNSTDVYRQQQQQQGRRQRRQRRRSTSGSGGDSGGGGGAARGSPSLELLSVACLHLASKYHTAEIQLGDFGFSLRSSEVFQLGFDIPLSMGPALNSSFRANAFSLQSLFCALANESPVVRACCDWFSLCLVVLLHPADDHDQHQHLASSPPGDRDLLSPASSSGTAPITPASSYASTTTSTTTATPAPPSPRAPDAPSRAESGGISLRFDEGGAAITPATASAAPSSRRGDQHEEAGSNPGSHRQQRQHHHNASGSTGVRDRFSRATIHALGSVVLARRLARARGACLPAPVQAMMGLAGNPQEAFELLLEGVRSARQAFGTELEARQHYCNQPGGTSGRGEVGGGNGGSVTASDRGILAGEIFFERRVVGQAVGAGGTTSTISRTLLEWVTDDRQHDGPRVDDSASAAGDTESDGKPAAAATAREQRKRRLPPDFIQGVRLSSVTASIPAAPSPVGGGDSSERKHGSGACPRTPGSGISGGGAGGGASFGGSDTDTDPCRRGLRSVDDGAGSGWVGSTSGDGSLSYSVSDLSSSPEEEEKGSVSRCLERCDDSGGTAMQQGERYVLSNGGRCVFDDGAPSSAFSWTASSCTSDDSSSDSGSTPSLRSPSGGDDDQTSPPLPLSPLSASAAHVKQPAHGREEETPSTSTNPNISGDITASHDVRQRPRGKRRKINPRASQDATTTTAATKPHTNTETEGSSARARGLPARKAPNPEQQKNARWEALLERVLTALDDRCGCSFCGLRNGRVGERGDDDDDDDADGSSYGWVGDVDRGRIVGNDCLPPPSKRADTDGKRKSTVAAVKSPASPSSLARSSNFPPPIPVEEAPAGKSSPADKPPFPTTPSLATFSPFTPPGPPPPISTNPRSGDREPNGETLSPRDGTTTEGGGSGGVCGNGRGTGVACGTLVVSTIALASLAAVRMGGEAAAATAACGEESEGGRDWWW